MDAFLFLPKILFDHGAIAGLPEELAELGVKRPLVVSDKVLAGLGTVAAVQEATGCNAPAFDGIPENPTDAGVEAALEVYKAEGCDSVIALGGGSVIDSSKALAVLAGLGGTLNEYRKDMSRITKGVAPLIALPTTAGTGSEVTQGCGIHPTATTRSFGFRSPHIKPKLAVCDPDLTFTLPPALTAATGMDALTQCIEGYLAVPDNAVIDAICLDGARRAAANIDRAFSKGDDRQARWEMMLAGLEGGIAINKGLGPAHAIGNTFGDRGYRHGDLVTLALPVVIEHHAPHVGDRLDRLAEAVGCGTGDKLPDAVRDMIRRLDMPLTFTDLGYRFNDIDEPAEDAARSFFNAHSPHKPDAAEYRQMIEELQG